MMQNNHRGIKQHRRGTKHLTQGDETPNTVGLIPLHLNLYLTRYLTIPRATQVSTMHKPCDETRPNGIDLQTVLTQVGLVALRMEGEIIKPLQVPAMRQRRQREYTELAAAYLNSNLDQPMLDNYLDPSTIPIEALANEVVATKLNKTLRDAYHEQLTTWVDSQAITYEIGDHLAQCCQCFDTGADFHDPTNPTRPIPNIHNPIPCAQCSKGNHQ